MTQSASSMYNQTNDPSGLVWVESQQTTNVPDAVYAGSETNGLKVYVARGLHGYHHLKVGKFVDNPGYGMYISHGGREVSLPSFQLLTNPAGVQTKWALGEGTRIPPTAVVAGSMVGEPMYIGRTKHQGSVVVGYIYPANDGRLCYSWGGEEHTSEDFEILLAKPKPACQCDLFYRLNLNCSKSCANKNN